MQDKNSSNRFYITFFAALASFFFFWGLGFSLFGIFRFPFSFLQKKRLRQTRNV